MNDDSDGAAPRQRTPRAMALARAIRGARGDTSQVTFSERLGRPQSTISYWETGLSVPSLDHLAAIEETLGLPLGTLAAQAGFFTAEAAISLPGQRALLRTYRSRSEAFEATAAADVLGLGLRLANHGGMHGEVWTLEVAVEPVSTDGQDHDELVPDAE